MNPKQINRIITFALLLMLSIGVKNEVYAAEYSGTYGKEQSWFYNSDSQTLYLSCDYESDEKVDFNQGQSPWNAYLNSIQSVKVMVNYLGDNMFNGCENLEEEYFNRNVEKISESAFSNCPKLKNIKTDVDCKIIKEFAEKNGYTYIVNSSNSEVTSTVTDYNVIYKIDGDCATVIGTSSKKLKKATIKDSVTINHNKYKVTKIAKKAFKNCKKLRKITINSNGITKIGKGAFKNCKQLKSITVKKHNEKRYSKLLKKAGYKNTIKTK